MKSRRRNNKDFATKTKGGRKERRKRITKRQFYKGGNKNRIQDSLDRFVAQLTPKITEQFQVGKYHNEFTTIKKLLFYLKEGKYGGYELSHPNAMQKIREDFSKEKGLRLRNPSFFGKYRTLNNTMLTINQLKTRVLSMLVEHENSGGTQIMEGGADFVGGMLVTKDGYNMTDSDDSDSDDSNKNVTIKAWPNSVDAVKQAIEKGIRAHLIKIAEDQKLKEDGNKVENKIVNDFTKNTETSKKLSIGKQIEHIEGFKTESVQNMENAKKCIATINKKLKGKDEIKSDELTEPTNKLATGTQKLNKYLESLSQIFDKKKSNYHDGNRINLESRMKEIDKNIQMVEKLAENVSKNIDSYKYPIETIDDELNEIKKQNGIYEELSRNKNQINILKRVFDGSRLILSKEEKTKKQKLKLDDIRKTIKENVTDIKELFGKTEKEIKDVTELVKNSEETLEKAQKTLEKAKETLKNAEKVKNEINRQVDEENKKFTTFVKNAAGKNNEIKKKLTAAKTLFKEATNDISNTARKNTTEASSAIHKNKEYINQIADLKKRHDAIVQELEKEKQSIIFKETFETDEIKDSLKIIKKNQDTIQNIFSKYKGKLTKNQALARKEGHAFDTKKSIVATYEQNMNYRREIYLLKEMAIERESTFDGRIRMARRFKLISYFYTPIRGIKEALKKGGIDTDGYYSKIMPYANTILTNSNTFELLWTLNFILARVLIHTPAYYLNSGGGNVRNNALRKALGYETKSHDDFKKEIKDTMKTASEIFETTYGMTTAEYYDLFFKDKQKLYSNINTQNEPLLLIIELVFRIAAIATILSVEFSAAIAYLVLGPLYVRAKSEKTKDLESLIKTISDKNDKVRLNSLKEVQKYSRDFDKLFSTIPEKVKKIANPEELLNDELSQTVSYYGNLLSYLRVIAKGKSDDKLERLIEGLEKEVENLIEEYSTLLFYFYGNRDIINRGELLKHEGGMPKHKIVCQKLKGIAEKVIEANKKVNKILGKILKNGRYKQKEDEIRTIVDNSFQVYMMGDSPFKNTMSGTSFRNRQDALQTNIASQAGGAIEPTSNYLFPKNLEKPLQYFKELVWNVIKDVKTDTKKLSLNDTNTGEKYYGNKFKKTFDSITKYAKTQLEKEKQERDKTKNETEKALFTIVKSINDDITNYNTDENGQKITYKDENGKDILDDDENSIRCPESENMGRKKAIEIKQILEQEYSMNMPLFVRTIVLVKFMGDTNWKKGNKVSLFSQHFTRFVEHYIKNMTRFIKIFEQIAEEEPNLTMEEFSDKFKRLIATFIQKINDEDYKTLKSFVVSASKKQATINVNFPDSRAEPKTELHKQYYYALTELLEKAYDHKKTQNTFVPDLINILRNFHSSLCMTNFDKEDWVKNTKPYSLTDFKKLFTTKDYDAYSKKQLSMWRTIWKDKTLETVNRGIEALILKTDKISKLAQKIDEKSLKIGEDELIDYKTIDDIFKILELKTESIFETRDLTTYGIKLDKAQTYYVNCVLNLCLVINHFIGQIQSGFQSHFPTRYLKEYIDYSIRAGKHEGDQPNIIETGLDNIKKYNYYVKMMYINTCVDSLLQKEEEKTPIYYFRNILLPEKMEGGGDSDNETVVNDVSDVITINTEFTVTIEYSWPENIVRIVNNLGDDNAELTQLLTSLFNQLDDNNISKIINASPDPQYLQKVLNHLNYNDERMRNTAVSLEECLWPYIYDTTLKSHTTEILWQRGIEEFTPLLIYRLVSITDTTNMVKLITNYEAVVDSNKSGFDTNATVTGDSGKMMVKALHEHTADEDDELAFDKDDMVEVLEMPDGGWWKGRFNGKDGLFPVSSVEHPNVFVRKVVDSVPNNILTVFKKMFNDKKKESSPLQLSELSNYDEFQIEKRKISNQSYAIDNVNRAEMRENIKTTANNAAKKTAETIKKGATAVKEQMIAKEPIWTPEGGILTSDGKLIEEKQSGGNSTKQYTLRDALDAIFGSANEQNQNIPLIILILHTLMTDNSSNTTSNPDQEISGQEIMSKIIEELYENPKNYIAIGRIRGILTKNEDDLQSVFDNEKEKLYPFKPTIDTGSLDAHVLPDEALDILNKIPKIDPVEPLTSTTLKKAKEEVDKNNQELKQKREEKEKKLSEGERQYRGTLYDLVTTDSGNDSAIQDKVYNIHKQIMNNRDADFPKHDLVAHLIDFLEPENLEIYPSETYKKDNPGQETRRQIIQDRLVKENTDMYVDPVISNVVNTFIPTADAIPIKQDPPSIIQKTTEYLTKLYPTTYFLNNSEDDNKTETYGKRVTKQKDTYKNGSKISFDMLNLDNNLNMLWNTGANLEYADSYKPKFQELYSIEENVSAAHANPPPIAPASK